MHEENQIGTAIECVVGTSPFVRFETALESGYAQHILGFKALGWREGARGGQGDMVYARKRAVGDDTPPVESVAQASVPLHEVAKYHQRGLYEKGIKPLLDRLAGITLSILTLPLVAIIVPGIWMKLGAPAIYHQRRLGHHGREFTVYKFRTMETDRRNGVSSIAHADRRVNHKSHDDPRHIPYGRFLRKWSLDEIPQFWNIALGNMAVVGPRPELPQIVADYDDWQHRRHEVKPGLTGLWQVTARGDIPMHEGTAIDIDYVEDVTFRNDVWILINTPAAVLGKQQGK
jgi:lipopolysaccharide/colanic/teichoic acid biosynthesis glycosyltransferase